MAEVDIFRLMECPIDNPISDERVTLAKIHDGPHARELRVSTAAEHRPSDVRRHITAVIAEAYRLGQESR